MKEEFHQWHSDHLGHDFQMLVFGHSGFPLILFPTHKGSYYESKDMGLIYSVADYIENGKIKVYSPDSIDSESWLNYDINPADRVKNHMAFETMILQDILEFAFHETGHEKAGIAGCCFGAYHAANITFRHPDKINYLFCMNGTFDIKPHIFGYYDEDCYFNNPFDYLPNLADPWYLDRIKTMGIALGTGENDISLENNKTLSSILSAKGIPHWLDIRGNSVGGWDTMKNMFRDYIALIKE
jgi:esterase/lipase superfamily enzyme